MLDCADEWLRAYAGDTSFIDRFSTSYWLKKRTMVDLAPLRPKDREIAADLRALQVERAATMGTVTAVKGQVPRDFAPWNLHWTGDAIWGFDLEGHRVASLAQAIGRFRVLAVEQSPYGLPFEAAPQTHPVVPNDVQAAAADPVDTPDLMAFVYGDMLFDRFVKWVDHGVIGPRLIRAIKTHLDGV